MPARATELAGMSVVQLRYSTQIRTDNGSGLQSKVVEDYAKERYAPVHVR
jgi:hypothetical protein